MKKIISLLLSFITLFTISISPVFATENQNEILFDLYSTVYNYGEAVDKIVLYTDDLTTGISNFIEIPVVLFSWL